MGGVHSPEHRSLPYHVDVVFLRPLARGSTVALLELQLKSPPLESRPAMTLSTLARGLASGDPVRVVCGGTEITEAASTLPHLTAGGG